MGIGAHTNVVAILEDDPWRVAEMRACIGLLLVDAEIVVFEVAAEMIAWLHGNLSRSLLISLDHDLPINRGQSHWIDHGTGRQVADFLASQPPTCPVIVHSSNLHYAPGMCFALEDAHWPVTRVFPTDDVEWVRRDWGRAIKRLLHEGWITLS